MLDTFHGCLLGLALGDALCADREGGLPERLLWKLLGRTRQGLRRYTDDTQTSLVLAEHLARQGCIDQDRLAAEFAAAYHWSRGYGPGTVAVLKQIRAGAAMRIAPLALLYSCSSIK